MGTDDIYDSIFAAAKMVGNIGALDVTSSTWFGNDLEYVHGINMYVLYLQCFRCVLKFIASGVPFISCIAFLYKCVF